MSQSFPDLGVSAPVVKALAARGITTPFPIQGLIMTDALAGRDVLAKSQTGSGKTLAFAIPIVERLAQVHGQRPQALVLVPTRELASQVVGEFEDVAAAKKLHVAAAYGGVSIREQSRRVAKADILVATPGRLEDLAERGLVRLKDVRILVLDEADRMLDMGFEPQVADIARRLPRDRQTMFFSATLESAVGHLAARYTKNPVRHEIESPKRTVEEAQHRFVSVSEAGKVDALVALLTAEPGLALVFTRTKRGAGRLAERLEAKGSRWPPCTGTSRRPLGSGPSSVSTAGRSAPWWPPTWPPAGWTSKASPTSSTTTRPPTTPATSTAWAGRRGPGEPAAASPWSRPSSRGT